MEKRFHANLSVIRQKGESQNGRAKKIKQAKFSEKRHLLPPPTRAQVCLYQGVRNARLSKNLALLCFLETPVLRFALLPYCLQMFPKIQLGGVVLLTYTANIKQKRIVENQSMHF